MSKTRLRTILSAALVLGSGLAAQADNTYSNAVLSLSPVAYWPLNETTPPPLAGNIASNLGTAGSTYDGYYASTVTLGVAGALTADSDTAASFNGSSGYIDIPYGAAESQSAPFTVEAWLNAEGNTATACALSSGQFASPRAGWLLYNVGTGWSFRLYNQNGTATSLNLTGGTIDANWHHIVAEFDGTNGYLYQDGVLVAGPTAATGYVSNPGIDLTIGARSDGGFIFNGSIDEVGIYTNVLAAADVLAHYQNGTSSSPAEPYSSLILAKKPQFYYRLDESLTTVTSTVLATNYGSLGSSVDGTYLPGTTPAVAGPNGKGFGNTSYGVQFLPATGGYVDCTGSSDLDIINSITVVAWFKGAPADSRFQSFLGRGDGSWRADVDASGYAHFADGSNPDATGTTFVNDGNWHFFAGVYDGATNYLYLDGALNVLGAASAAINGDESHDLVIGGVGDYIPGRLFKGSVAQVAVFTNALTASQIQKLYNAAELYPAVVSEPKGLSLGLGASDSLSATVQGAPTLTYQWFQGASKLSDVTGNISGSATSTLTITNAQVSNGGNYTLVANNSFGSVTSSIVTVTVVPTPYVTVPPSSNTVVYAGNQVSLNVVAIGAVPLSYQWYKGSTAISGATATNLVLTPALGTNLYKVVITNSYGSYTSSVAAVVGEASPATLVVNYSVVSGYAGPGAYSDPGNNYWNAFPGTTGVATGPAYNSATNLTLVSATLDWGFSSGTTADTTNGTASDLLSYEYAVNSGSPGIGTADAPEGELLISDLPQGTYKVYLYGANYDGDRGSLFTLAAANGGEPDLGLDATTNGAVLGVNAIVNGVDAFAEGDNYVLYTNVVADVYGNITVYYTPDLNQFSGLSGEAPFNGVQAVLSTVIPTLGLQYASGNVILTWTPAGAALQSSTNVAGPFTTVTGATSPYTNAVTGGNAFFRVKN